MQETIRKFSPDEIKIMRGKLGLSLDAFGERYDIHPNAVQRYEAGVTRPTLSRILVALMRAAKDADEA